MPGKFDSYIVITLLCILLLPLVNNCSNQPEAPPNTSKISSQKFYLGLIPEQDLFSQKERYEPLARYLSEKADLNVRLRILPHYGSIIDNFIAGELDGAFFGSFIGALAISKLGVEPLARPLWLDDTSTYYGMIFVRKDSNINNAADMKGKRFAFVDTATTAGWLLPLHFFQEIGITDYRQWFSETYFTGTHEDTIKDVLEGKADIGAAKNTVFYRLAKEDHRITDELQILATSPKVPSNTLAVRKNLDDPLKEKLKNILLQMHEDKAGREILQKFGAKRFIETTVQDYEPVFNYADQIRLDLNKYDHRGN
jgi:phosphonate transport system substrate-binding protein